MIRVNSQSGKGGVAYILKSEHKLDLPRRLQIEFSRAVQQHTDDEGGEMSPADDLARRSAPSTSTARPRCKLNSVHTSSAAGEKDALEVNVYVDGELRTLTGTGNGPIAAFVNAIDELADDEVRQGQRAVRRTATTSGCSTTSEHALSSGGDAIAAAYVECAVGDQILWGVGARPEHRHRVAEGRDQRGQPGLTRTDRPPPQWSDPFCGQVTDTEGMQQS